MQECLVKTNYYGKDSILKVLWEIIPYIVIIIASCIAGILLFYEGTPSGDDIGFHYANIYYLFKAIKNNESLVILSETFGGIGYAKGLFYSPLSHTSVALMGVLLEPFGITLMQAFKITIFITLALSGVFMYRFSMHITSNKKMASIIVAVLFVIMPYRLFNYFARFAFAEGFSILFLPLFFMGLYDFTHIKEKEEFSVLILLEIIFGAIGTYLSHNITGLFAFAFGVIYLLCYIDVIIKKFMKDRRFLIYTVVAVGLILGLLSLSLVRTFTALNTGIYNVSDKDRMWTYYEHVADDTSRSAIYTGFVNMDWLRSNGITISDVLISFISYLIATTLYILLNFLLAKIKYKKFPYFTPLVATAFYILFSFIFQQRIEFIYSIIITATLVTFITYARLFMTEVNSSKAIYKDRFLYVVIGLLVIAFLLLTQREAWKLLPEIFYTAQFAWRINAIISILVPMLLAFALKYFSKELLILSATIVGLIPLFTQVTIEKRVTYEYVKSQEEANGGYNYQSINSSWRTEIDGELNDWYYYQVGFNKEYFPNIYGYFSDHTPVYSNSLYKFVWQSIGTYYSSHPGTYEKVDGHYAVLTGDADIDTDTLVYNAPITSYDVKVNSVDSETGTSIIQVAVIYYPGYYVTVTNKDTGETYKTKPYNPEEVDYLLSVELKEGNYSIVFNYEGTPLMRVSNVIYYLSIVGVFALVLFDSYYIINKRKKDYIKY